MLYCYPQPTPQVSVNHLVLAVRVSQLVRILLSHECLAYVIGILGVRLLLLLALLAGSVIFPITECDSA